MTPSQGKARVYVSTSTAGLHLLPGVAPKCSESPWGLRADLAYEQTKETPPPSRRRQAGPKQRCALAGLGQEGGAEIWEGAGKFTAPVRKSGPRGKRVNSASQVSSLQRPIPFPAPSPPTTQRPTGAVPPAACAAPSPGSPCAFWKRLPGCTGARGRGRRETSPICWRASSRWPPPAACAGARGCEDVDVCACVCAPPPGRRGPPCASFSLGPHTPPPAAAKGSQVAAWPRRSWIPPLPIRAPLTRQESQEPTPQAPAERGWEPSPCALRWAQSPKPRGGAERTAPCASSLGLSRRPRLRRCSGASFCSPGAPQLCTELTPFLPPSASSGDSCYCQHPRAQAEGYLR